MAGCQAHQKLTAPQVLEIKALLKQGVPRFRLGPLLGVTHQTLEAIDCGKSFSYLNSEEDLYRWHVVTTKQNVKVAYPPAIVAHHDTYGDFTFSSYALRQYGKRFIELIIDSIEYCEHGATCEECCFTYTGAEYEHKKQQWFREDILVLPLLVTGPYWYRSLMGFLADVVFGRIDDCDVDQECHNKRCANIYHAQFVAGSDRKSYYANSRKKAAQSHY